MANLTWRDVANPDISGAVQGYTAFSRLLGDSLDGLKSGVSAFDQVKSDAMNKQFSLALGQLPNAEALAQAAASGSIGGIDFRDPVAMRRLSQANLSAVGTDAIQSRAAKDIQFAATQRTGAEQTAAAAQQAALDAQDGVIGELTALSFAPPTPERNARMTELRSKINYSGLGATKAHSLAAQSPADANTAVGYANSALGYTDTKLNFDNKVRDQKIDEIAYNIAARIGPTLAGPEFVDRAFNDDPEVSKLDGRTQAAVRDRLRSMYGGASAPGAIAAAAGAVGPGTAGSFGGGGAPGSATGDFDSVVFAKGQYGLPPRPLPEMTIAEVSNWSHTLGKNTAAAGIGVSNGKVVGTSAVGPFQIQGRSTLIDYAKKMGLDPNTTRFDLATQDKIARRIFEDSKGGDLKKVWASLPNSTPGAYANKSWEEVRDIITAGEAGATYSLAISGRLADTASQNQISQTNANSFGVDWQKATGDLRDKTVIADELTAYFADKKVSRGDLLDYIGKIQARGAKIKPGLEISASEAAAIIRNSTKSENIFERILPGEALGKDTKLDWRVVDGHLRDVANGNVQKTVVTNSTVAESSAISNAALQSMMAAKARLQDMQTRARNNPRMDPKYVAQAEQEYNYAQSQYAAAVAGQRGGTPGQFNAQPAARAPSPEAAITAAARPAPVAAPVAAGQATSGPAGSLVRRADGQVYWQPNKGGAPAAPAAPVRTPAQTNYLAQQADQYAENKKFLAEWARRPKGQDAPGWMTIKAANAKAFVKNYEEIQNGGKKAASAPARIAAAAAAAPAPVAVAVQSRVPDGGILTLKDFAR